LLVARSAFATSSLPPAMVSGSLSFLRVEERSIRIAAGSPSAARQSAPT
jgi:hypothetical protein